MEHGFTRILRIYTDRIKLPQPGEITKRDCFHSFQHFSGIKHRICFYSYFYFYSIFYSGCDYRGVENLFL